MMSERQRRGDVVLTFVCEWSHGDDDRADCHIVEEVYHYSVATSGFFPLDLGFWDLAVLHSARIVQNELGSEPRGKEWMWCANISIPLTSKRCILLILTW